MNFLLDIQRTFSIEIILIAFILINTLISVFVKNHFYAFSRAFALVGIIVALFSSLSIQPFSFSAFANSIHANSFILFCKILILISTCLVILMSNSILKSFKKRAFEYFSLIFADTLAAMCLVSANDFLTMFVSFELLGVSSYLLVTFSKNVISKEAGLKYLINGSVTSAVMLYGISYIYGFTGLLNFCEIINFYSKNYPTIVFSFSLILITFGLLFKVGAVPFQKWVPDIYQGSCYPVACFLSVVPKIAGFAFLIKLVFMLGIYTTITTFVIMIAAILSIFYGSLGAIKQNDVKRFLGYSSIAHSGFILLGFCSLTHYNISAILFYIFSYIFMNIGVFAATTLFNKSCGKNFISDYKGIYYSRPYFTFALTICLLSLAGIPLTSGFLAKIYLFSAVARSGILYLIFLILSLIGTIIALYAYLRFIKVMFEKDTSHEQDIYIDDSSMSIKFILYFCATITVLLCIFARPVIELCLAAIYGV